MTNQTQFRCFLLKITIQAAGGETRSHTLVENCLQTSESTAISLYKHHEYGPCYQANTVSTGQAANTSYVDGLATKQIVRGALLQRKCPTGCHESNTSGPTVQQVAIFASSEN